MDVEMRATNVVWHRSQITRDDRRNLLGHWGGTVWLTGLPASGKSTTAYALERELIRRGILVYVLDGDNVRHGLNKDLAFSARDREENVRRVAEVAKLFAEAGVIVITSFISPYRRERDFARRIHMEAGLDFTEIFVDTPIEMCEQRDPKSQYARARKGELKGFTGVDDPYEQPLAPELVVRTDRFAPELIVEQTLDYLRTVGCLPPEIKFLQPVPRRTASA